MITNNGPTEQYSYIIKDSGGKNGNVIASDGGTIDSGISALITTSGNFEPEKTTI